MGSTDIVGTPYEDRFTPHRESESGIFYDVPNRMPFLLAWGFRKVAQYCSDEQEKTEYTRLKEAMGKSHRPLFSEEMSCSCLEALATDESDELVMSSLTCAPLECA